MNKVYLILVLHTDEILAVYANKENAEHEKETIESRGDVDLYLKEFEIQDYEN